MVLLVSEHLSSGSEHHACRASIIYSKHQGTSTQMVVTGFDITLESSSEYIRLDEVDQQEGLGLKLMGFHRKNQTCFYEAHIFYSICPSSLNID